MPIVLDIGCGDRSIELPAHYAGWTRVRLDVDPALKPDILLDARKLTTFPPAMYDAAYCAHNLEHYHRHDGLKVLVGMRHVLKPDGFAEIRVPDLGAVVVQMAHGVDLDDVLYESGRGPILVRDVIYGYHVEIEQSGNDFFLHKTGFTRKSLMRFVGQANFERVIVNAPQPFNLAAFAFCREPGRAQLQMLNVPGVWGSNP